MTSRFTPARLIASGLATGYAPVAPGTAGSLLGLAAGAALLAASPIWLAIGTIIATIAGLVAIPAATSMPLLGATQSQHSDPGWVVIDEIAGQMLALLALPHPTWAGAILAFATFRLLDITKPGPIGWADRQHGAAAVMADDLIAGLGACLVVAIAHHFAPNMV